MENGNTPNRIDNLNSKDNDNQNFINLQSNLNQNTAINYNNLNEFQNFPNPGLNQIANIDNSYTDIKQEDLNSSINSNDRKNKKPFMERVGDWVCIKCKNLNFSFRVMCNRCQMTKYESERLTDQYLVNYSNYIKFNEMMQQRILMNHPMNIQNNQGFFMNNGNFAGNNFINYNNNNSEPSKGFIDKNKASLLRMPNDLESFNNGYFQNLNYDCEEDFSNNQEDYDNKGDLIIENNLKIKVNGQNNNNQMGFKNENIRNFYNSKRNVNSNDIGVEDS